MIRAYSCDDHHDRSRDSRGDYVVRSTKQGHRDSPDPNQRRQSPEVKREKEQVDETKELNVVAPIRDRAAPTLSS